MSAANSLPCLNSNNSIGTRQPIETRAVLFERSKIQKLNEFSTSHRKSAYALELNVKSFIDKFGINHVGFLTLTFKDHVTDAKEAQRRFNSLRTNFLKKHYPNYIRVIERTKSGRIHYHLIVATKEDIRRGLNFQEIAKRNYKSANLSIRMHWQRLRDNLDKYGFGRAELLPVKTNSKGLARYVAKYIGKHINNRQECDKGVRLCQTSIDKRVFWKVATSHFSFLSKGSAEWRRKLALWVDWLNPYLAYRCSAYHGRDFKPITVDDYGERLKQELCPKWAFKNRETINKIDLFLTN